MITVFTKGGLGNQLFQFAGGQSIANSTGRTFYVETPETRKTDHSNEEYFDSIFKKLRTKHVTTDVPITSFFEENEHEPNDWISKLSPEHENILLYGYFQHWKYVPNDFATQLTFDTSVVTRFPMYKEAAFLHIRGGDYKNNWLHDVGLDNYYERAIQLFDKNTHFYIFTNDVEYAKSKLFLKTIKHSFVFENEVNSLYLMSQCGVGGICANSTFSWWGAYLNPKRNIIFPSKWYNDSRYSDGYYFDGCTVVSV